VTSPLNVEPGDLLSVANGHLMLMNQLGQTIDLTQSAGIWPSQAGVMAMKGQTAVLTQAMMTQLGLHSANLTQAASAYQGQEAKNNAALVGGKLDKDTMAELTQGVSQIGQMGAQAMSQTGQMLAQTASQFGQVGASTTNQMVQVGVSAAAQAAKSVPVHAVAPVTEAEPGSGALAAPAAALTDKQEAPKRHSDKTDGDKVTKEPKVQPAGHEQETL
jgi:hypothetical protein